MILELQANFTYKEDTWDAKVRAHFSKEKKSITEMQIFLMHELK